MSIMLNTTPDDVIDRACIEQIRYEKMLVAGQPKEIVDKVWNNLVYINALLRKFEDEHFEVCGNARRWLCEVHNELWDLEDAVRSTFYFDPIGSVQHYTRITELNDLRARIKKYICRETNTEGEAKQHVYTDPIYPDVFLGFVEPGTTDEVLPSV